MKVLLVNGSARKDGCTYTALMEVAKPLHENGIETELFHIGTDPVRGCLNCRACLKLQKCVQDDDICNELSDKIAASDGVVIGSPVFYAGPSGALCAVLDRVFFSSAKRFLHKPAAAVVNCRRGGASSAFDRLNKYFTITQMPVISSQYWNATHGFKPDDVLRDAEGLQTMRTIGRNMAWLLKLIEAGIPPLPQEEKREFTSFPDGK